MNTTLKPCPFCGGEAKAVDGWATGWYGYQVGCDSCDFHIVRHGGDEDEVRGKVTKLWNTRAERTCEYIGDEISGGCSECRGWLDPACAYCPNCGAKVVE